MTATAIMTNLSARGVHLWAEADRLKFEAPAGTLTDEDRATLREHKAELLALLSMPGRCPSCHEPANLQDKARDAWYCPRCRKWLDGQGQPLPKTEKSRPLTLEDQEARKLIVDLKAAGCGFVANDGELRMTHPLRMSAGLWARFENAGPEFRHLAREEARRQADEEWEARSEWMS